MAPDPRLDEMSLAREAEAAGELHSFPRPQIEHFGVTTIGLGDGDILGSLVGALSGAIVGLVVALAMVDGLVLTVLLPLIGAGLGAVIEAVIAGGRADERRHRWTHPSPPRHAHQVSGPAVRQS